MDIHIATGGRQLGPFSLEETRRRLAADEFQLSDLAWTEGQAGWAPLSTLPGFTPAGAPPPLPGSTPAHPPSIPAPIASQPRKTSGLAITSLIFGILSVTILPILAAVPAIICGHIAHARVKRVDGRTGGGGVALAGLIMGYVSFCLIPVIAILAGIALPVFASVQERGGEIKALNNAKQIATACKLYAVDHGGAFPATLEELVPDILPDRSIFICPYTPAEPMGYNYYPGKDTDPATNVLLVSKGMSKRKRRIVVHVDSSARIEAVTPALPTR